MGAPTSVERLYRSKSERMLFGVCGGLATYFDLDPTLVRLIFVLLTLATGIGLIIYIVMAIITPQDPFVTIQDESTTTD